MVEYEEYEETCWKCRGKGVLIKRFSVFKRNTDSHEVTENNLKECPRCKGNGFVIKRKKKIRGR